MSMSAGETERMHPLYFLLCAWIVLIAGDVFICAVELGLKKMGLWESAIVNDWWVWISLPIWLLVPIAFIVLGSHGLIMWCAMEGSTIGRSITAFAIGLASLPAGFGLWLLLSMIMDSDMCRNLP